MKIHKSKSGLKIISNNRKARFNYFFKEFFEAGIVLMGSEVKSLRDGKANISESYAFDIGGEIFLIKRSFLNVWKRIRHRRIQYPTSKNNTFS